MVSCAWKIGFERVFQIVFLWCSGGRGPGPRGADRRIRAPGRGGPRAAERRVAHHVAPGGTAAVPAPLSGQPARQPGRLQPGAPAQAALLGHLEGTLLIMLQIISVIVVIAYLIKLGPIGDHHGGAMSGFTKVRASKAVQTINLGGFVGVQGTQPTYCKLKGLRNIQGKKKKLCKKGLRQADGTRFMLLLCLWGTYLINRAFEVRRLQMRFPTLRHDRQARRL